MFKVCVKEGLWIYDEYYVDNYILAFNKFEEWFRLYNYTARRSNMENYLETKILIQNDFTNEVYASINVVTGESNEKE